MKTKWEKDLDKRGKSEQAVRAIDESLQHIRGITLRVGAARADVAKLLPVASRNSEAPSFRESSHSDYQTGLAVGS